MKNFDLQNWRTVLAVSAAAMSMVACSTPPVPDRDSDPADTAWWAYQDCMETLSPNQSTAMCDSVGTTRSMPRYQYTGGSTSTGGTTTGTTGGRGPYGKAELASSSQISDSYRTYLHSLDAETQAELAAKWKAVSR